MNPHRVANSLRACGEALRALKARRSNVRRRIAIGGAGIGILLVSAACPPLPRLVWNASASVPIGLYLVTPGARVSPGDIVIARLPERFQSLAAYRRYLPLTVPLVKRVAAYAGDDVCANGRAIFINDRAAAIRQIVDAKDRPMPTWEGCVRLRGQQIFLLTPNPASFDGRYFGVTEGADVVGKADPLWLR